MNVCAPWLVPLGPEEDIRSPRSVVIGRCELHEALETKPGPLQEQQVLRPVNPSLHPNSILFIKQQRRNKIKHLQTLVHRLRLTISFQNYHDSLS